MKNEKPTQEEKAQYFAQHIRQPVYVNNAWDKFNGSIAHLDATYLIIGSNGLNEGFLSLTSLADITDEYAIEVAKIYKSNVRGYSVIGIAGVTREEFLRAGKEFCERLDGNYWNNFANIYNMLSVFDFLRSRGYALPWRGYTVEQLISFGWLKLRGKGGGDES